MKFIKSSKGFTLIELLAVIIVLAIVMLIAANSVLPLISDSRENAFVSTVNNIIDTVETVHLSNQVSGRKGNCYDIDELVGEGYLDNITKEMYDGRVIVNANNTYSIVIKDTTNGYYVNLDGVSGLIKNESVNKTDDGSTTACPTDTQVDLSN